MGPTAGRRGAHTSVTSPAASTRPSAAASVDPAAPAAGAALGRAARAVSARYSLPALVAAGGVLAAIGLLIARLVPAVRGEPLFEDEAVTGLIGARPSGELLRTVVVDRGGAPLHFLLAHVTFAADPSWVALRWLSAVFAVATIPLVFDLGRRLAGPPAGALAALVAATSTMLGIYGTFGRMYSLFAFVAALAVDLFVRALQERTGRAAALAAAAAWLLPATHPYGIILVGAEVVVALAVWRGRPLRPALPAIAVLLATAPFVWADVRLSGRFAVGVSGDTSLAGPGDAWSQLARALAAFAGGSGALFALFLVLGGLGLFTLARRNAPLAALALIATLVTPLLFMILGTARSEGIHGLSPRHLVFLLPIWCALVSAGALSLLGRRLPFPALAAGIGALALAAALAPAGGVRDPRDLLSNVALGGGPRALAPGTPAALAAPAAWLRRSVRPGDVTYPIAPVFFAALPQAGRAHPLPRAESQLLLDALRRARLPAHQLFVAVPVGAPNLELWKMRGRLGRGYEVQPFSRWTLVRVAGPFPDATSVLAATFWVYRAAERALQGDYPSQVDAYLMYGYSVVCNTLHELDARCTERPPPSG
jgi:hypothetical protein